MDIVGKVTGNGKINIVSGDTTIVKDYERIENANENYYFQSDEFTYDSCESSVSDDYNNSHENSVEAKMKIAIATVSRSRI